MFTPMTQSVRQTSLEAHCNACTGRLVRAQSPWQHRCHAWIFRRHKELTQRLRLRATETDGKTEERDSDLPAEQQAEPVSRPSTQSHQEGAVGEVDLAKQLRRLRSERQPAQGDGFVQGIIEETQLIEWPKPLQAVKDTFLVIAILAGTTVFLFLANSVMADASARFLQNR